MIILYYVAAGMAVYFVLGGNTKTNPDLSPRGIFVISVLWPILAIGMVIAIIMTAYDFIRWRIKNAGTGK
jgi:hypothetical protein